MRAIVTTLIATLFLLSTSVAGQATGRGGSSHFGTSFGSSHHGFPQFSYHPGPPPGHPGPPPGFDHHPPKQICKIVIIKYPKIIHAAYGPHKSHKFHVVYVVVKKIICHPPFSY
jgi:hypothetical protein